MRFGAGLPVPLQDVAAFGGGFLLLVQGAAGCCQSGCRVLLFEWRVRFGAGLE